MDKSISCECGSDQFWYFGEYVRCPKCFNEMKLITTGKEKAKFILFRRFNHREHTYNYNWIRIART